MNEKEKPKNWECATCKKVFTQSEILPHQLEHTHILVSRKALEGLRDAIQKTLDNPFIYSSVDLWKVAGWTLDFIRGYIKP